MISRLQSGRFWLKLLAFGSMAASLAAVGLYIALQQMFKPSRLHAAAQSALAGSGFTLHFDQNIGRTWLPRPTVTLKNAVLAGPGAAQTQHLGDMSIGLAWSSLFGSPTVEKWVVANADILLEQNSGGGWNLQTLWQNRKPHFSVNRLIVENARIRITTPSGKLTLAAVGLRLNRENGRDRRFLISAQTAHSRLSPLNWQAGGLIQAAESGWNLPDLYLKASAQYGGRPVDFTAAAAARWQNRTLSLSGIRANLNSPLYQTGITAAIPAAEWKNGRFSADSLNSTFNAHHKDTELSGVFNLTGISAEGGRLNVRLAALNAGSRSAGRTGTFNISSPVAYRHAGNLWRLSDLKITTRQNRPPGEGGPRFTGTLAGSFESWAGGGWQTRLSGLFDRQPAALRAVYDPAKRLIRADAGLDKLVFAPYLGDFQNRTAAEYPTWLTGPGAVALDLNLRLDQLQLPQLTANHIRTRVEADSKRIALSNFSAELYGGVTAGSLHIENQNPPAYRLRQQAENVQILPLMQDFLRYGKVAGLGDAAIDFTTRGRNRRELTQNLNGRLNLKLQKGALIGIDIDNIISRIRPGQARDARTSFNRFTLNSLIQNGTGRHQNAELITDRLYILSNGSLDLNRLTMNENMLVGIKGSNAAAIPLNIRGTVDKPSVTLNYHSLTHGLATPEEKQKALSETLKEWNLLNRP